MHPGFLFLLSLSTAVLILSILLASAFPHFRISSLDNQTHFPTSFHLSTTMGNKAVKTSSNPDAKSIVDAAISTHPVVIFSKTYCPYCHSAKADIGRAAASVANFPPPKLFELDTMGSQGRAIQSYLATLTGRSTVPNVFIAARSVGGGDEIAGFARRNVLKQMLTQAADRLTANARAEKEDAVAEIVETAIKENSVVVFSKSACPYCHAAKRYIGSVGETIPGFDGGKVVELDYMGDMGRKIQAYLLEKTGRSTVPNVFIGGVSVGGGDEVGALVAKGSLGGLIANAVKDKGGPSVLDPAPMEDPASALVEEALVGNQVVVFSKTYCPYCSAAKATLETVGGEVEGYTGAKVFELDTMGALGENVQRYLAEKTGQTTVPNIFIDGKAIGGNDAVSGYAANGALRDMLAAAVTGAAVGTTVTASVTKEIVFGAGCFWGVELAFQRVVGVDKTEVGYSNGNLARVTYDAVCSGRTGSVEVVRVTYNPAVVALAELLKIWESRHDPTSMNKQGNDVGTQYRSGVYYYDEEQAAEIAEWKADADSRLSNPVVSEIAPVHNYCTAEDFHQQYLEKKGQKATKGDTTRIRCYG